MKKLSELIPEFMYDIQKTESKKVVKEKLTANCQPVKYYPKADKSYSKNLCKKMS